MESMSATDSPFSRAEVVELMKLSDKNFDGEISYDEWLRMMLS